MRCNGPVIPYGRISPYLCQGHIEISPIRPKSLAKNILRLCIVRMRNLETEIHARSLKANEVLTPMKGDSFIFPVADGTVKTPRGDRRLRPSTSIRDRPERREEQRFFKENQTNFLLQPFFKMTQHGTMRKPNMISGFFTGDFIYSHHVEPRVKLYMPKEESFLIPMKYIDVSRTTHTSLDVLLEKQIDDYWNVDEERELSDAWTGFTRFILLNERRHLKDIHGPAETNNLKTRQSMATYMEAYV